MNTNQSYSLTAGSALTIQATLRDASGNAIAVYTGAEALATTVWPGGTRVASFSPTTTWVVPADGTIQIVVTDASTATLDPGRYQLLTRLQDAGQWVDCFGCYLDIAASAGTEAEPKTYGSYDDLLQYGRGWLKQLATSDDEAGFAEQRARARTALEDAAHAHFRVASMVMVVGGQGMGPRRSGSRSVWLQEQLDADKLIVTDQVKEACAKRALAYVCEGQVGVGDAARAYGKLAAMYHSQANYIMSSMTLSLDTDSDGFADVNIDLTCSDPLFG